MFTLRRLLVTPLGHLTKNGKSTYIKPVLLKHIWNDSRNQSTNVTKKWKIFGITGGIFLCFASGVTYLRYEKCFNSYFPKPPMFVKALAASVDSDSQPIVPPPVTSLENLPDLVDRILPGVVTIRTVMRGRGLIGVGNGSGFFISPDGLLMTNFHVIGYHNNSNIEVVLHDGTTTLRAKLVGVDADADLAVLKVDPPKGTAFPYLRFADPKTIRHGDFVVAIGSPHFLSNSITVGVVSSKARHLDFSSQGVTYVQTDAAITNGNSGGPLVNMRGEVIGINAMRIEAGISFAISIENTQRLLALVRKRGLQIEPSEIMHNFMDTNKARNLGIAVLNITDEMWQVLAGMPTTIEKRIWPAGFAKKPHGVFVQSVSPTSVASRAGIRPGDIITHANSRPIHSPTDLKSILAESSSVSIRLVRGENELDFPNISLESSN